MKTGLLAATLLGLLAFAVWYAIRVWSDVGPTEMNVHGYLALVLMIVFSLLVGVGLMALVYFSNRRGYDEPPDIGTNRGE